MRDIFTISTTVLFSCAFVTPASAIVMTSATPPTYAESEVARGEWTGVLQLNTHAGNCTAALIGLQHALTATHCFYSGRAFRSDRATLVRPGPVGLKVSKVMPLDGYDAEVGHQRGGRDLTVLLLAKPVAAEQFQIYKINSGKANDGIVDETAPELKTVKVGNGTPGNGVIGADKTRAFDHATRLAENVIDGIGDGNTFWNSNAPVYRDVNGQPIFVRPPANTLVYDFDDPNNKDPQKPETSLKNRNDQGDLKMLKEGIPAPGDSGGPLFQFNKNGEPILVGVTSSSLSSSYNSFIKKKEDPSVPNSKYGDIVFDTRVPSYFEFVKKSLELKPNGREGVPAAGSKEQGSLRFDSRSQTLSFSDAEIDFANFDGGSSLASVLANDSIMRATLSVGGFSYAGDFGNGVLFTGGALRIHVGARNLLVADVPRLLIDESATAQYRFNYWGEVGDPEPVPSVQNNSALLEALIRITRNVDFPLEIMGRATVPVLPAIRSGQDAFSTVVNHSISASMRISEPGTIPLLLMVAFVGLIPGRRAIVARSACMRLTLAQQVN